MSKVMSANTGRSRLPRRVSAIAQQCVVAPEKDLVLELRANARLRQHPIFRGRSRWLKCNCHNGRVLIEGYLPSYYLKQLAQEALRDLDGVETIENQIVVASPVGEVRHRSHAAPTTAPLTASPLPR